MDMELDLYSGRPNPEWCLGADQVLELQRRLKAATAFPVDRRPEPEEALGYRGVKGVGMLAAGPEAEPRRWAVSVGSGAIHLRSDGDALSFLDPGRQLERWLLQSARGQVESDLLDALLASMGHEGQEGQEGYEGQGPAPGR